MQEDTLPSATNIVDAMSEAKKRSRTQNRARQQEEFDDDESEECRDDDGSADDGFMEGLSETLDSISEAMYTASGRSIADLVDYHLKKINNSLVNLNKTHAQLVEIKQLEFQSQAAMMNRKSYG